MKYYKNKETGELLPNYVILSPEDKDKYEVFYDYHLNRLDQINERLGWILFIIVAQIAIAAIAYFFF